MFPALKLSALLLATSLVPGLHVPDLHVVTAPGTIVGFGDCDSVTGGPGAPKDTTIGDETSPFYWGRDGMNAFCMYQPQLTTHPVRITLVYPPSGKPDHWNVAWGQRDGSQAPIFTGQHQVDVDPYNNSVADDFGTRPVKKNVYAFFRAQSCSKSILGHSNCVPWSKEPYVVVHLGAKELTAY